MLHRIVFVALIFIQLGCSNHDDKAITAVKAELETHLLDPASVQYRNIDVKHFTSGEPNGVCFEYNSRNIMGHYVGFKQEHCLLPDKSSSKVVCLRSMRPEETEVDTMGADMAIAASCSRKS